MSAKDGTWKEFLLERTRRARGVWCELKGRSRVKMDIRDGEREWSWEERTFEGDDGDGGDGGWPGWWRAASQVA